MGLIGQKKAKKGKQHQWKVHSRVRHMEKWFKGETRVSSWEGIKLERLGMAQGWEGIRTGAEVARGRQQAVLGLMGSLMGMLFWWLCGRQESRDLTHLFRAVVAREAAELGEGSCLALGGEGNV